VQVSTSALLVLTGLVACANSSQTHEGPVPFRFRLAPPRVDASGRELWDATVQPDDVDLPKPLPTTFRLRLDSPRRRAQRGAVTSGVLSRGDPGGAEFLLLTLVEAFDPSRSSGSRSGGASLEPTDSIPLRLTVRSHSSADRPWLADVTLPNGGRFVLALDSAAGRGEFRPLDQRYNLQVVGAIAGLFARR
jgi:hypothetical protein